MLFDQLQRLGIVYDDVAAQLEDNGVTAFDHAWQQLGEQLAATLAAQSARQQRF